MEVGGERVWGQWSAMSSYPTAGEPPKAAASSSDFVQVTRGKKKEKPKKTPQQEAAVDPEELERKRQVIYIP